MYQPKVRDDLIRRLYRLGQVLDVPMTSLASVLLEMGIKSMERALAEMGYVQPGSDTLSAENPHNPSI